MSCLPIFIGDRLKRLELVSEIPPSVNHYLGYRAVMHKGRAIGMSYKTKGATDYRSKFATYVEEEVGKQGWDLQLSDTQHFYVDARFFFPRTDMDANNYFKIMLDAITDTQLIWADDNVVCERVQKICYDSNDPRIELSIYPVDYIGVFENASQLDTFVSRCIGCTRYSRNCSLLNRAKLGYIQEEVDGISCTKYKGKNTTKPKKNKRRNKNGTN